jgi:hypothetical protein
LLGQTEVVGRRELAESCGEERFLDLSGSGSTLARDQHAEIVAMLLDAAYFP